MAASGFSGEGRPRAAVPGLLSLPLGLGGVDRAVRGWKEEEIPGCPLRLGLQPRGWELGFLACTCSYFVSACLCPVCMCAEASAAPRVCTFCVRSKSCLEKCPRRCGLRRLQG